MGILTVIKLRLKCLWCRCCVLFFKSIGTVRKENRSRFHLRYRQGNSFVKSKLYVDIELLRCVFNDTSTSSFTWETIRYTVAGGTRASDKRRTYYGLSTDEFSLVSVYDYPNLKFMKVDTNDE